MNHRGSDNGRRTVLDPRDAEIQRLKRENARLRAEAKVTRERLEDVARSGKEFARLMKEKSAERRRLAVQYAVMRALSNAGSLEEAAPHILSAFGERLGWRAGALWVPDGQAGTTLRCAETWRPHGVPPGALEEVCRRSVIRYPGVGAIARTWTSKRPAWLEDLNVEKSFPFRDAALAEGLRSSLAFPILNGRFHGIIQFFSENIGRADENLVGTADIVGRQIGQFVERREAERRLDALFKSQQEARREADRSRRRSESILESIGDAFFALDADRHLTYVNREAERFWGEPRENLLRRNIWEAFPRAVGTPHHREVERAFEEGTDTSYESFLPDSGIWVSGRAYPTPGGGVSVYFRDVTEQRRAEEALRESEERYRSLVTATSSIVWTAAPSGECVAEMPSWEDFTGQTFEEYRGFGWLDAVHPDDRPPMDAWDDLSPGEAPLEVEYRLRRRDGEYRRVVSRGVPVLDEGRGVREWVGTMSDVEDERRAEEANAYLATVVRSSGEALIGLSADGVIESWNPAAERIYGYSAEEAVGQPISLVAAPDGHAEQDELMDLLKSGRAVSLETSRLTKDGRRVEVRLSVSPVGGAAGRIAGFSVTITDITARKQAEREREELRRLAEEEQARLEAVLQQMPGGVFIADPSGEVVLANEGVERIYGKRLRSVEECGEHALSYPDGRELPPEEYPLARALAGGFVSGMEHYVLRADGARGVVSVNAAPVRDEEGRIVAAVKAFEDVTRQKEAQAALRESEQRLSTVVEGSPVILFSLDRDGAYTLAEGQGLKTLGLEPGELVGRSVFDVFEDEPETLAAARRALSGEAFAESVSMRGRVFEVWFNPLRDGRRVVSGVTGVATDVTERRSAEEERDSSRVRELEARAAVEDAQKRLAFFAGAREERKIISRELHDRVAHSMAVVRQCLELHDALKERNPEAAAAKVELAREEAKVALNSTRDLSMMLRRSEVEEVGLEQALQGLLETTVSNGVRYEVSVEGDEALVPNHVGNQLFLILREAVRNAVTHASCRSMSVELDILPERVGASVRDDGRGFDGEERGEDRNGENGGVGLRSMKERAAMLGGSLNLTSAPGAGTRVEVSIPLAAAWAAASGGSGDPLNNPSGGTR